LELGGTRRVLAVVPRDAAEQHAAEVRQWLGVDANVVPANDNSMTLCVEANQIPLRELAVELVQRRRERIDFASRVQSRTDIEWTPLLEDPVQDANPWAAFAPPAAEESMAKTMVL
jgi:hypothetical protein